MPKCPVFHFVPATSHPVRHHRVWLSLLHCPSSGIYTLVRSSLNSTISKLCSSSSFSSNQVTIFMVLCCTLSNIAVSLLPGCSDPVQQVYLTSAEQRAKDHLPLTIANTPPNAAPEAIFAVSVYCWFMDSLLPTRILSTNLLCNVLLMCTAVQGDTSPEAGLGIFLH